VYSVAKNILKHEDHTFSAGIFLNAEYMDTCSDDGPAKSDDAFTVVSGLVKDMTAIQTTICGALTLGMSQRDWEQHRI